MELTSDNKLGNSKWKGGDATHLDIYKQKASHHGQDSTNDGLATPTLPRLPLLQPAIPKVPSQD